MQQQWQCAAHGLGSGRRCTTPTTAAATAAAARSYTGRSEIYKYKQTAYNIGQRQAQKNIFGRMLWRWQLCCADSRSCSACCHEQTGTCRSAGRQNQYETTRSAGAAQVAERERGPESGHDTGDVVMLRQWCGAHTRCSTARLIAPPETVDERRRECRRLLEGRRLHLQEPDGGH